MQNQSQRIIRVQIAAPPKPRYGAPCNGCGICCLYAPCPVGALLSRKRAGRCAVLQWDDAQGLYRCGVVGGRRAIARVLQALPTPWNRVLVLAAWPLAWFGRRWIAAGVGCDSTLEVEPSPTMAVPDNDTGHTDD